MTEMFFLLFDILVIKKVEIIIVDIIEIIAKNIRDKFGLVPSFLASDQRMTPFGISALYLSTEKMACVAEIRALVGQYVGIAEFSNRIELKLLNLI